MKTSSAAGLLLMLAACLDPNVTQLGPMGSDGDPGSGGGFSDGTPDAGTFVFDGGGCALPETDSDPVVSPTAEPPALSGGTLLSLADGTVVVADSDRDAVYIFDADLTGYREVDLEAGDEPGRVVAGPSGEVFVALRRGGKVAQLDLASATVMARHDACVLPRGIAWSDARQTLYVACGEGVLSELQIAGASVISGHSVAVANDLRDVVPVGDAMWVTTFRTAQLFTVGADDSVREVVGPASTISPGDPSSLEPRVAWRAIATPGGVLIVHQATTTASLMAGFCNLNAYGSGGASGGSPGAVHTHVTQVLAATGTAPDTALQLYDGMADVDSAVLPVDIAQSEPDGEVVIAAAGASELVTLSTMHAPNSGILYTESNRFALDGVPSAVGLSNGRLLAFIREPAELVNVVSASTIHRVPVTSARSVASTGFDLFHRGTGANIACASCHPEAEEDGNVWNLPEGTVRTPTLRGGITTTAPFHWAGEETSLGALMFDIFGMRMGGPAEPPDRVAALGRWLDAQPVRRQPPQDAASVSRGLALFNSSDAGCVVCHTGALGTNNTTVEVGTDRPLQVPRLVELAYRTRFLHDGRAPTLRDRFSSIGGGDLHGHTSQLTAADIDDLIAYLRSR
jgi:mono/diheme cytochrome c family protein